MRYLGALLALLALLAGAPARAAVHHGKHRVPAACNKLHYRKHHKKRCKGWKPKKHPKPKPVVKVVVKPAQSAPKPDQAPPAPTQVPSVGVGGNLGALGYCTTMPVAGDIMRIVLENSEAVDRFYQCAINAVDSGHRLSISIEYTSTHSLAQIEAWFTAAMQMYAPLHPFEVSIGNEQDSSTTPQTYVDVFNAVKGIVKHYAPYTLLGAGEVDPWALNWTKTLVSLLGPNDGVQVLAGHPYPSGGTGFQPAAFLALAHQIRATAWATEGLCGPDALMKFGCRPLSDFAGYGLAILWYTPPLQPAPSSGT